MDWTKAIEINRHALTRIIAALVALVAAQVDAVRLPLPVYQLVFRVLLPAEAAVRRLIVIAARGLVLPEQRHRPMPPELAEQLAQQLVLAGKRTRTAFQLFDSRKQFCADDETENGEEQGLPNPDPAWGPRIRCVGDADPRSPLFLAHLAALRAQEKSISEAASTSLRRRLATIRQALDTLPHQARRMARWQARRTAMRNANMRNAKFTSPLRPGPPPGQRKKPTNEIDLILKECHALAHQALGVNTS